MRKRRGERKAVNTARDKRWNKKEGR